MKYVLKLLSLENLPDTRPLIAADIDGNLFWEGETIASEFIDLGLTVKWRNRNLGANSITDYGDYYQWAATTPLTISGTTVNPPASWPAPYTDNSGNPSKYTDINSSTLLAVDDAATCNTATWRIPTSAECEELLDLPNRYITVNGVNGQVFCKIGEPGLSQGNFDIIEEDGLYLYDENHPYKDSDYGSFDLNEDFYPYEFEYQSESEINAKLTSCYSDWYDYGGTVNIATMLFKDKAHTIPAVAGVDYEIGSFPQQFNPNTMLFIPAGGFCNNSTLDNSKSRYWSANIYIGNVKNAACFSITEDEARMEGRQLRCIGCTIRPVSISD